MTALSKDFFDFFKDLSSNNNRDWFHGNKKRYEQSVKEPFKALVGAVIAGAQKIDPEIQIEPKEAIFRINRDIRFSKDKTPYKTNVSAIISRYGRKRKDFPGYYLHIDQGNLMIGGGAYFLPKEELAAVRQHIMLHPERFAKIIKGKKFVDLYGGIQGEANKRIPKEYKEFHLTQPLIANKQFFFMADNDPKLTLKEDVLKYILNHYKAGSTLNAFFAEALEK